MDRVLQRVHDQWLNPPEPKVAHECDYCGCFIYVGEEYLVAENGDRIHEECKDDWIKERVEFERRTAE
jgi:hypothetical protein